ncbi:MAG TPA: acylphosphatase [Ktedonobacterales bacterium]|nr:acylphosphatase [Ktedonobacterales bacterium]
MGEARPGPNTLRLTARVRGYVQGVGFRYFARRQASALGLRGYVRNLDNGDVEVVAEGDRIQLEQLLSILERGPSAADVEHVEATWGAGAGAFSSFQIRP